MTSTVGLKDSSILEEAEERLGLGEYAAALSQFINQCDTPMTVALQGDWGNGKMSLMNLIRKTIDKQPKTRSLWFNTWQYSQFSMGDNLAYSLISTFVDEIGTEQNKKACLKSFPAWR